MSQAFSDFARACKKQSKRDKCRIVYLISADSVRKLTLRKYPKKKHIPQGVHTVRMKGARGYYCASERYTFSKGKPKKVIKKLQKKLRQSLQCAKMNTKTAVALQLPSVLPSVQTSALPSVQASAHPSILDKFYDECKKKETDTIAPVIKVAYFVTQSMHKRVHMTDYLDAPNGIATVYSEDCRFYFVPDPEKITTVFGTEPKICFFPLTRYDVYKFTTVDNAMMVFDDVLETIRKLCMDEIKMMKEEEQRIEFDIIRPSGRYPRPVLGDFDVPEGISINKFV